MKKTFLLIVVGVAALLGFALPAVACMIDPLTIRAVAPDAGRGGAWRGVAWRGGGPNPGETQVYAGVLYEAPHNEQGGRSLWLIVADFATASTSIGYVANDVDFDDFPEVSELLGVKFAMDCDPKAEYTVTLLIEYQCKPRGVNVPEGQPVVMLANVQLHGPSAMGDITLPNVSLVHTVPGDWVAAPPIAVAGTFRGVDLASPDTCVTFAASMFSDAAGWCAVRVSMRVQEMQ